MARMVLHSEQRNRPGLAALSFLLQIGTGEDLGEHRCGRRLVARLEEGGSLLQIVLNIEELGEAEQLEDFVDLGLDLEQDDVAAPRLDRLEEGGEGAYAGRGDVVEAAAVENEADEAGVDGLADSLLKEIGVIGIDIAGQEEGEAILHGIDFLETDL